MTEVIFAATPQTPRGQCADRDTYSDEPSGPGENCDRDYRRLGAAEVIHTVISLGSLDLRSSLYRDANAADGTWMQWWLNAATVLGWLLSSIFVLSFASPARSV